MTLEMLLRTWAEVERNVSLDGVGPKGYGNAEPDETAPDNERAVWYYVRETEGFEKARDALVWMYVEQKDLKFFPYCEHGESLKVAAERKGQSQEYARIKASLPIHEGASEWSKRTTVGLRRAALSLDLFMGFRSTLAKRMRTDPYAPPHDYTQDEDVIVEAEKVTEEYERRFPWLKFRPIDHGRRAS